MSTYSLVVGSSSAKFLNHFRVTGEMHHKGRDERPSFQERFTESIQSFLLRDGSSSSRYPLHPSYKTQSQPSHPVQEAFHITNGGQSSSINIPSKESIHYLRCSLSGYSSHDGYSRPAEPISYGSTNVSFFTCGLSDHYL